MRPFEAIIVLADISGYTRFVVRHRGSLMHAEQIVTELMEAVTANAAFPLVIRKLEGDAAFMTAEIDGDRRAAVNEVARQVLSLMALYAARQRDLFERSVGGCPCPACQSVETLSLKCVMHVGEVLEKRVGGHLELAGEPVIVAHRLLKNSVGADSYLLVTEAVERELEFRPFARREAHEERVGDVGAVRTVAYLPEPANLARRGARPMTRPRGMLEAMRLMLSSLALRLRRTRKRFRNLPS